MSPKKVRNHYFYVKNLVCSICSKGKKEGLHFARIWTTVHDKTSCTVSYFYTWFAYKNWYRIFFSVSIWISYVIDIFFYNEYGVDLYLCLFGFSKYESFAFHRIKLLFPPIFIFIQTIYLKKNGTNKIRALYNILTNAILVLRNHHHRYHKK